MGTQPGAGLQEGFCGISSDLLPPSVMSWGHMATAVNLCCLPGSWSELQGQVLHRWCGMHPLPSSRGEQALQEPAGLCLHQGRAGTLWNQG